MPPRGPATNLTAHLAQMQRAYGDRVAPAAGKKGPPVIVSTGVLTIDHALREGGWRQGRIHEIVGPPDSGKSTTMIYSAAEQQRRFPDRGIAYVDMEGTFDDDWAESLGLDLSSEEKWRHLYPSHSEDASDMARECCSSGLYSSVIVDSIGGMESKKAFAKDAEDDLPGKNAQVISRMVKHLASLARQNCVTVLLVNQYRSQIGSMGGDQSAGGKVLQHATTTKLVMSRAGGEDSAKKLAYDGVEEMIGLKFRGRVTRSKIVAPGRQAEFWIFNRPTEQFGAPGVWRADEYASLGIRLGAIAQGGSWYTFPNGTRVNGRADVVSALNADPKLMELVRAKIFEEAA